MKQIVYGVSAAWIAIVALAWWLAERRIHLCDYGDTACAIRTTAARDSVLLWGPAVPLGVFVVLVLAGVVRTQRLKSPSSSRGAMLGPNLIRD